MKKIFTTLFLVMGIYSLSNAQTTGDVIFGANIGLNSAYVVSNNQYASGAKLIPGINLGISAEYLLTADWGIKAKLTYDQKGWGDAFEKISDTKSVGGVNYRVTYLTIPVMASWHFGKEKNWYVNGGPFAGILLSASEDYQNLDLKNNFNSVDGGVDLGAGLRFPLGDRLKIFIEYSGQIGFVNILKNSVGAGGGAQSVRSGFNVGLNF